MKLNLDGERMDYDFWRRQAAKEDKRRSARRRREERIRLDAERRNADRIDGYDRDDLGESPDY